MWTIIANFKQDKRGNVAIIFGLTALPLILGLGIGLDYTSATQRRLRLNAAADAAALLTVTPSMLAQPAVVAQLAAQRMFDAQVVGIPGVTYQALSVNVQPVDRTDPTTGNKVRTTTVTYSATSSNIFSTVLGKPTITIGGMAASTATFAPNIDFYLLIDTSPSMAIAATTADINKMVSLTPSQGGCAFACHESNAKAYDSGLGNPGGEDNYKLARDNNVTLRIDVVNQATQSMVTFAQNTETAANVTYRIGAYTYDYFFNQLAPNPATSSAHVMSDLSQVKTLTSDIQSVTVFKPGWITSSINDNEADSNFDLAMNSINTIMPTPGNGTNLPSDTPQEVLFIVSDGVTDEPNGGVGSRSISAVDYSGTWCKTVKDRGIRIAFLYTTYNPLPTNGFYNQYVGPYQSQIGSTYAKRCASPGLYTEVNSNGDITAAMLNLFTAATKTPSLTQ